MLSFPEAFPLQKKKYFTYQETKLKGQLAEIMFR